MLRSSPPAIRRSSSNASSISDFPAMRPAIQTQEERLEKQEPVEERITPESQGISIIPQRIAFDGFTKNVRYKQKVQICNFSAKKQRILVIPPKPTSNFYMDAKKQYVELSPGLRTAVTVYYESKAEKEERDHFKIDLDGKKFVRVPVESMPCMPKLEFESNVDFGTILLGRDKASQVVQVKNVSQREGLVKLAPNAQNVVVRPAEFKLQGGESGNITIEYAPTDTGAQTHSISIRLFRDAVQVQDASIRISASVIPHKLNLVVDGAAITDTRRIDFGSVYYGQTAEMAGYVENHTSEPQAFSIAHTTETPANVFDGVTYEYTNSTLRLLKNENADRNELAMRVEPREGVVPPRGRVAVRFTFSPSEEYVPRAFRALRPVRAASEYAAPVALRGGNSEIAFEVAGRGEPLRFSAAPRRRAFGVVVLGARAGGEVVLRNESALRARFVVPPVAQFVVEPRSGELAPGESRALSVVFWPNQLGMFRRAVAVEVFSAGVRGVCERRLGAVKIVLEGSAVDKEPRDRAVDARLEQAAHYRVHDCMPAVRKNSARMRYVRNKHGYDDYVYESRTRKVAESVNARVSRDEDPMEADKDYERVFARSDPGEGVAVGIPEKTMVDLLQKLRDTKTAHAARSERDVRPVSPEDAARVFCGAAELDFGSVTVHSENTLALNFLNAAPRAVDICVSVESQVSGLLTADRDAITVAPNSVAGVLFTLQAHDIAHHGVKVYYAVRGRQRHAISVKYDVVPVNLAKDFDSIDMFVDPAFHTDAAAPPVGEKVLTLTNPGNYAVGYEWRMPPSDEFEISPRYGAIQPHASVSVTARYRPGLRARAEALAELCVQDVYFPDARKTLARYTVAVRGEMHVPQCALVKWGKTGVVDFGTVAVSEGGASARRSFKLRNSGAHACFYSVQGDSEVAVSPAQGVIQPGGVAEVCVSVQASVPKEVVTALSVVVLGRGKPIRVPVRYVAVAPDVLHAFHFVTRYDVAATTMIGSWSEFPFDLKNVGHVPGTVVVDLAGFPDFELRCGARVSVRDCAHAFTISPGELLRCAVQYKPVAETSYNTSIPMRVAGAMRAIDIPINVQAVASPITISRRAIEFGNKVVHERETTDVNHFRSVMKESVEICNTSAGAVSWFCDANLLEDNIKRAFRVEPWTGRLDPGESVVLTAQFAPGEVGSYACNAQVFVDVAGATYPFMLALRGNGVLPSVAFDPPEIFLPTVPFGSEACAVFSAVNYGCERSELRVAFSEQLIRAHGKLEFCFPEGRVLKGEGERLLVVARFSPSAQASAATTGFVAKAEFSDGKSVFYVNVRCGGDRSAIGLLPFLAGYECRVAGDGAGFVIESAAYRRVLDESRKRTRLSIAAREFRTPGGVLLTERCARDVEAFYDACGDSLQHWLAAHYDPERAFPDGFAASPAQSVCALIAGLAGRKTSVSGDGYRGAAEMLTLLKSHGAVLHCVLPEHLLTRAAYDAHVSERLDALRRDATAGVAEEYAAHVARTQGYFSVVGKEAWVIVLAQIVRVFMAGAAARRKYPGNVYTHKELAALSWAEGVIGRKAEISTYGARDWAKILGALGASVDGEDADAVVQAGEAFGGQFRMERVLKGEFCEAYLTLMYAYQASSARSEVAFSARVGASQAKVIEFSNPSGRAVVFRGRSSCDEFVGPASVTIPSKGCVRVSLAYNARQRASKGVYVLSARGGINIPLVHVVEMVGNPDLTAAPARRRVKLDAVLYAPTSVDLEVVNPYGDAVFEIALSNSLFSAEEKVEVKGGGTAVLRVGYVPVEMGVCECVVDLRSEEGEIGYIIETRTGGPKPIVTSPVTCKVGERAEHAIVVPVVNAARERAMAVVGRSGGMWSKYKVEYSHGYFSGPSEISIRKGELVTSYSPSEVGVHVCRITVSSGDDVRVYSVTGVCTI